MMISTRGRYALRVLADLAEHTNSGYVPMKDVAARQEISLKYLERIMPILTSNGLVEGVHGKGGGYKLTKKPEEYRVGDILRLTEVSLSPVVCLENNSSPCPRRNKCTTVEMWSELSEVINNYLDTKTVADLINKT